MYFENKDHRNNHRDIGALINGDFALTFLLTFCIFNILWEHSQDDIFNHLKWKEKSRKSLSPYTFVLVFLKLWLPYDTQSGFLHRIIDRRTVVTQSSFFPIRSHWHLFTKHVLNACPPRVRLGFTAVDTPHRGILLLSEVVNSIFQCLGEVSELPLSQRPHSYVSVSPTWRRSEVVHVQQDPSVLGYLDL